MTRYIIRRGLQSLLLLWLSTLFAFSINQLAPGGPFQFLDSNPTFKPADAERMKALYGLQRAIPIQYVAWLLGEDWLPANATWRSGRCLNESANCSRGILRLDFGKSFAKKRPVSELILERVPATAQLAFANFFLSILIGIPLGILAALNRGRWIDNTIRTVTVVLNTVPDWWLGLLLLIILGGYLKLVPLSNLCDVNNCTLGSRIHHLILPALVGATGGWIGYSRILRAEMLDVLSQDYVRTARAKGLPEKLVILRHILRNAIMPLVTGLGGIFLLALSGSVLFEYTFSWPGIGRLGYEALSGRDYPLLMGLFVITSFLGILGVLFVDILYGFVDPRVQYD